MRVDCLDPRCAARGASRPIWRAAWQCLVVAVVCLFPPAEARSHPHVFVDGGVDFVLRDGNVLEALDVTWHYDEFETLYILSSYGMSLNDEGGLDEADRVELVRLRSDWPDDFDGSAHLAVDGAGIELVWPEDLDLQLVAGRLKMTFSRRLASPIRLTTRNVEVAFYESTYFFAFSITQEPNLFGNDGSCTADVLSFDPDAEDAALQAMLAELSREEIPDIRNVGALFADRIVVRCV